VEEGSRLNRCIYCKCGFKTHNNIICLSLKCKFKCDCKLNKTGKKKKLDEEEERPEWDWLKKKK